MFRVKTSYASAMKPEVGRVKEQYHLARVAKRAGAPAAAAAAAEPAPRPAPAVPAPRQPNSPPRLPRAQPGRRGGSPWYVPIVLDCEYLDGRIVAQHWAVFATTADAAKTRLWKKLALPSLSAPPANAAELESGECESSRSLLVFHNVTEIAGMNWDADNRRDFICLANIHSDSHAGQNLSTNYRFEGSSALVADIIREYDEKWQREQRGQGKNKRKNNKGKKGKSEFCKMFEDEAGGSGDEADHDGDGYDSADYSETEGGFVVDDHESESESESESSSGGGRIDAGEEFFYAQGPLKRRRGSTIVIDSDDDDDDDDEDIIKDVMARLVLGVITANKPKKRIVVEESEESEESEDEDELEFSD